MIPVPKWCKDCPSYIKDERSCEWHGPTKPFRRGCKDHGKNQKQESYNAKSLSSNLHSNAVNNTGSAGLPADQAAPP